MSNPIFTRTSTRVFTDEDVSEEDITLILKAGMQAVSAINQQPWEFYVVRDKEVKSKLANFGRNIDVCNNAPVVIVPCIKTECQAPAFTQIDLACCAMNMLLEIEELGLGAVFQGVCPNEERMAQTASALGLGDNLKPFCLIPVGHKGEHKEWVDRYDESRVHKI